MITSFYAPNFKVEKRTVSRSHRRVRGGALVSMAGIASLGLIQGQAIAAPSGTACPVRPALERLQKHTVKPNETLTQIANRYGLLSTTLMGINPTVRTGQVSPGQILVIPPYNGISVALQTGQTLQSVAKIYQVKPDVLFEVNGCQKNPKTVFVPGVNWSPISTGSIAAPSTPLDPFLRQDQYPLPQPAAVIRAYGWQPNGPRNAIVFSSGVDLAIASGTPVYAVADGTVAFAGVQKPWGNMVVINHARGRQTRYGYLGVLNLKVGQSVQRGQVIGNVGRSADPALRFELRYRSNLGWVAKDPQPYLRAISGSKKTQRL